jgi:threonine/homoserine/homoserine lactone efflux protein
MSLLPFLAFTFAAVALLGSPGPGITALVAVGRARGVAGGIGFYGALQGGLAIAAALSAFGLASTLQGAPAVRLILTAVATAYLLWLAWSIASAPVGDAIGDGQSGALSGRTGFMLGIANPKAYIAFASLMGSFELLQNPRASAVAEWTVCVAVMLIVDLAWLWAGAAIGSIKLGRRRERMMNVAMGLAIVAACAASFI